MKTSATNITDRTGKQYHIGCARGDLSEYILLVGDPERAEKISALFDRVTVARKHREFVTFTGLHRNTPLTVMATGIGADNTEIAVIEACQITENPTFIRCGSCSSLQPHAKLGELAISKGSVRMDSMSNYYVPKGYPAVADTDITLALAIAAQRSGLKYHVGITASAPGFYGPQGRAMPGFPIRTPKITEQFATMNVLNLEMETGALFTLAQLRGVRAGAVCGIFGNRFHDEFSDEQKRAETEKKSIDVTLEAFQILKKMDEQKKDRNTPIWIPEGL